MYKQKISPARLDEGSRVDFDMNNVELEEFTVCVIINPLTGDNTKEFISLRTHLNGGIIVRLSKSHSKLYGYVSDNNVTLGGYSDNGSIPFGEVTKIAVRFDTTGEQAEYSYFINGIKTHTFTGEKMVPIAFPLSGTGLIGSDTLEVYDFSFHTRALSDTEIKKIYNSSLTIPVSQFKRLGLGDDLLIALALDEENKAVDLSGNGYHGDLINDVTFDGTEKDVLHTGLEKKAVYKGDGTTFFGYTGKPFCEVGSDFSFCFFVDFTELTTYRNQFVGGRGKVDVRIENGNDLRFYWQDNEGSKLARYTFSFEDGVVYHIAGTVSDTDKKMRLYLNTIMVDEVAILDVDYPNQYTALAADGWGSFAHKGMMTNVYFGKFCLS